MPAPRMFLAAEWRWLAMLNYEIDPALLAPFVPCGTTLDTYAGKTFVSMVGFLFLRTTVLGVPILLHRNFEEVNLRFYVRRPHPEGDRRGVVFIKEIVPRWAIAVVARVVYNENYVALPMRHAIELTAGRLNSGGWVEYGWRFGGRWQRLTLRVCGEPALAPNGSEQQFITEHYWGYCRQRDGHTTEYEVEHPPWRLWQVDDALLDCNAADLYGAQFADVLRGRPSSAFLAEGSAVLVRRGTCL